MVDEVVLGNVMVDCDDERKLQRFYGELLGWEMCELFARPAVSSSSGIVFCLLRKKIMFLLYGQKIQENNKNRCILIFRLIMLQKWLRKRNHWGAKKAESQFGGNDFVTMFDPAGHPFCLCRK